MGHGSGGLAWAFFVSVGSEAMGAVAQPLHRTAAELPRHHARFGNALFVPPPFSELDGCLDALERFMQEGNSRLPALIKAGLLHVLADLVSSRLETAAGHASRNLTSPLLPPSHCKDRRGTSSTLRGYYLKASLKDFSCSALTGRPSR